MNPSLNTFMGMKIVVAGNTPNMKLSRDVPVTEEFRKEYDEWLKSFFGVQCVVAKGQTMVINNMLICHPADYLRIKALVSQR